jgi:hypothetical protein
MIIATALLLLFQDSRDGALDVFDGETLFEGGLQLTVDGIRRARTQLYRGRERVSDPLDRRWTEERLTLTANYGLWPDLTLSLLVPFVSRRAEMEGDTDRALGPGDVAAVAKFRAWKRDWHLGSFNWTLFAGGEVPTGRADVHDDGERLPPWLQPGSGSWDAIVATAATFEQDRFKLNGVLLGQFNGRGSRDYATGDVLVAELTPGWRVVVEPYPGPLLRLELGLQYRHEFAASRNGERIDDSGGDELRLKPAAVFWPRANWGIILSGEIPIWRELRGEQLGLDGSVLLAVSVRL